MSDSSRNIYEDANSSYKIDPHETSDEQNAIVTKAAIKNPALWEDETKAGESINDMYAPYISKYKYMKLYVGPAVRKGKSVSISLTNFTSENWRSVNTNHLFNISDSVILIPDDYGVSITTANTYEDYGLDDLFKSASEKMNNSLLAKGDEAIEALNAVASKNSAKANSAYISRYNNVKTWKNSTVKLDDKTFTFHFRFGQAGLFSGKEEVVKPILALTSAFAPVPIAEGSNRFTGPVPTKQYMTAQIFKIILADIKDSGGITSILSDIGSKVADTVKEVTSEVSSGNIADAASSAVGLAVAAKDKIFDAYNSTITSILTQSNTKLATFKMGNMVLGPYYVGNVKASFNFNHVDEEGFPLDGTVAFSDLSSPMVTQPDVLNVFNI